MYMGDTVLITDISRFAVNDGPGFRTNVYLKGCPLRCAWCHNPETMVTHPDIYWKRRLCAQCGTCMDACPRDAVFPPVPYDVANAEGSGYHKIDRARCTMCMKCVDVCPYGALEIVGRPMTTTAILDEVERDRPFYDNSNGGLTVSGGEPTMHRGFTMELLAGARSRSITTCLDTNGFCDFDDLARLAECSDVVLFDLKHMDAEAHREKTGVDNAVILENLEKICKVHRRIWVRIPVIPGFNDQLACHREMCTFIAALGKGVERVDLLPFHNWCQDKYSWLGIDWPYRDVDAMDPGFLEVHAEIYRKAGLRVTIGGSGFENEEGDTAGGPDVIRTICP